MAAIFFDLGAFPFFEINVIHFRMEKDDVGSARARAIGTRRELNGSEADEILHSFRRNPLKNLDSEK